MSLPLPLLLSLARNLPAGIRGILLTFDADGKVVSVAATDLDTWATFTRDGTPTSSAALPLESAKGLDLEAATLLPDGNLRAGGQSVPLLPPDDYPPRPDSIPDVYPLPVAEVAARVGYAVSADDTRYGLGGYHVETAGEGTLRVVATDGSRLTYHEWPYTGPVEIRRKLLPFRGVEVAAKVKATSAGWTDTLFRAVGEIPGWRVEVLSRVIDGEFPPYRKVLPQDTPRHLVKVSRLALLTALREVKRTALDRASTCRFDLTGPDFGETGYLYLSSRSVESGQTTVKVRADYTPEAFGTGFNIEYLSDVASTLPGDTLTLGLWETLSPCVVRDGGPSLSVVMPIRLEGNGVAPSPDHVEIHAPPVKRSSPRAVAVSDNRPSQRKVKPAPVPVAAPPAPPVKVEAVTPPSPEIPTMPAPSPDVSALLAELAALRSQVAALTAAPVPAPVAPPPQSVAPVPAVVSQVVKGSCPLTGPARNPEEASLAYGYARSALYHGDKGAMAQALAILPEYPARRALDLREKLQVALA